MVTMWNRCALVEQIDERGQRGRFAAAGRAGDKDRPWRRSINFASDGGKMQRFERRNSRRQQSDAGRNRAPLIMQVGAAANAVGAHKAEVERLFLIQLGALIGGEQGKQQVLNFIGGKRQRASRDEARRSRAGSRAIPPRTADRKRCARPRLPAVVRGRGRSVGKRFIGKMTVSSGLF